MEKRFFPLKFTLVCSAIWKPNENHLHKQRFFRYPSYTCAYIPQHMRKSTDNEMIVLTLSVTELYYRHTVNENKHRVSIVTDILFVWNDFCTRKQ